MPSGADVFSYHEDDVVEDPNLAKHLANLGINMMTQTKVSPSLSLPVSLPLYSLPASLPPSLSCFVTFLCFGPDRLRR